MSVDLDRIALQIDEACNRGDVSALENTISELRAFEPANGFDVARSQFMLANAYAGIRNNRLASEAWAWEDLYSAKEVFCLRKALTACAAIPFAEDQTDLRFRIETNLANALNHLGRAPEAVEHWDHVLLRHPDYAMADGNRALALAWYARALYDQGHAAFFFKEARNSLREALDTGVEPHAQAQMQKLLNSLDDMTDWDNAVIEYPNVSLRRSQIERQYHQWCVSQRLLLNPLNDLVSLGNVIGDVLTFPSIIVPTANARADPPEVYGIYNQLKQEFVSARYVVFEAIREAEKPLHFSDKGVTLYDMLDYRHYRLWIEKIKMAYLAAYSIFDKIAYLINEFWSLELGADSVTFRRVWHEKADVKKPISRKLAESKNWPLRGLFWLSRDLFFSTEASIRLDPQSRELYEIRNHVTHKYLRVHDHLLYDATSWRLKHGRELSYPVSEAELKTQAIKLLKLVRSALIYVSLAAHWDQARNREQRGLVVPIPLHEIDDGARL